MKKTNIKKWIALWMAGSLLEKMFHSNKVKLYENYKYNQPFQLPKLSSEEWGNTFYYHKNIVKRNNEEYANKIAEDLEDITGIYLLPVEVEQGSRIYKIKFKPMKEIRKSYNLRKEIEYVINEPNMNMYKEGAYIVIEIPKKGESVLFGDFMHDAKYQLESNKMVVPIGQSMNGDNVYADIADMPHMLVAGTTGSGKSVFLNGIITSLLMKNTPYDIQLFLIDPKMVEFSRFASLKYVHYESQTNKAVQLLNSLCKEMDKRYELFANHGCRDLGDYNKKFPSKRLPRLVLVIDEMADMMSKEYKKQVEANIVRIAQKARASGIHMILATQRPTVNVISGLIKANIPCRVALSVTTKTDSMVILDRIGAENLLGNGDMLFLNGKNNKQAIRLQAGMLTAEEINNVVVPLTINNQGEYHEYKEQVYNRCSV